MMEYLLRFKKEQKYVIFDAETENLDLGIRNRPWQLGILDCKGENIINSYNLYPKWEDLKVSEGASKATHFNYEAYRSNWRDARECLDILDSFLYNPEYLILFHNGLNFDIYIHRMMRLVLGLKSDYSYINRCLDTNALAKAIKLNIQYKPEEGSLLEFQYKMIHFKQKGLKTNLMLLGQENSIPFNYENLHSGIEDTKLLWLIWNKWIKHKLDI